MQTRKWTKSRLSGMSSKPGATFAIKNCEWFHEGCTKFLIWSCYVLVMRLLMVAFMAVKFRRQVTSNNPGRNQTIIFKDSERFCQIRVRTCIFLHDFGQNLTWLPFLPDSGRILKDNHLVSGREDLDKVAKVVYGIEPLSWLGFELFQFFDH